MTKKVIQKYAKPKMICPFCQERKADGNFRPFAVNGISMHVRMMHPERDDEFQTHRQQYIDEFACDNDGILLESKSKPNPESKADPGAAPAPVINTEAIPIAEHDRTTPEEISTPPPQATPPPAKNLVKKPEPPIPQKENFQDEQESRGYNPYASGY